MVSFFIKFLLLVKTGSALERFAFSFLWFFIVKSELFFLVSSLFFSSLRPSLRPWLKSLDILSILEEIPKMIKKMIDTLKKNLKGFAYFILFPSM